MYFLCALADNNKYVIQQKGIIPMSDAISPPNQYSPTPSLTKLRALTESLMLKDMVYIAPQTPHTAEYETVSGTCISFGLYKQPEVSIMRFYASKDMELKKHFHNMHEILGIYKGDCTIVMNDEEHIIKTYDTIRIPAQTEHTLKTDTECWGWCVTMPADEGYVNG